MPVGRVRRPFSVRFAPVVLLALGLAFAAGLYAICTTPSSGPDVIVARLYDIRNWVTGSTIDGKRSYSVGTESLNEGSKDLKWISGTNEHPVIGQNLYRLKTDVDRPGGRLEQVGLSWLKHGFTALTGSHYCACTFEAGHGGGTWLGMGCDDPYSGGLNGDRNRLGPRYQVNAITGNYTYPFDNTGVVNDELDRRIIVSDSDVDPTANSGARYFMEGQYITEDDATSGNGWNNASFREAVITNSTSRSLDWAGSGPFITTQQRLPAIMAWPLVDSAVVLEIVDIAESSMTSRLHLAAKVFDNGDGTWRYEYAIHNLNSHRSVQRVEVPVPTGAQVTGAGFHDVDYHSGEPYVNTDWTIDVDVPNGRVAWFGETFATNANANALRWGTMYNYWFDADQPPGNGLVELTPFRPAAAGEPPGVFHVVLPVPGGGLIFADDYERGTASAWQPSPN